MNWFDSLMEDVPHEESVHQPRSLPLGRGSSFQGFPKRSACDLLVGALGSGGHVDFPTVTEICEGVMGNDQEMAAVAHLLSAALQNEVGLPESSLLSLQLKALTVAHELLYDADARKALIEAPGLLCAVKRLRLEHLCQADSMQRETLRSVGGPAGECVRLLTSEICRSLDLSVLRL